jgi:type VI secretion system protein VasL
MSPVIFLDDDRFTFNTAPDQLVTHRCFIKLKQEVQRKVTPFSGGIDWALVVDQAVELGNDIGVDVEVAIYYLVGSFKHAGLNGFGNGLELLYTVLTQYSAHSHRDIKSFESLLGWGNQQAIKELANLRSTYEVLRDLYRIERSCERINHLIRHQYPQLVVDYETLGLAIFEHIDAIETSYQLACKRDGTAAALTIERSIQTQPVKGWNKRRMVAAYCSGVVSAGLLVWITLYVH